VRQGAPSRRHPARGRDEPVLTEVADGVWVRQSEWVWTNSIAVRGEDGLILIDPGITGAELHQLADDVDGLGIPVVAGFSTHPHWDHLLWHPGSATCRATWRPAVGLLTARGFGRAARDRSATRLRWTPPVAFRCDARAARA
jgi:glyoxylase-like metal-dependent hydrolase (beta-lactamase superfamily II)